MSDGNYESEMKRLSGINGEKYDAIKNFLDPPRILSTEQLLVLGRLRDEYAESFDAWMAFCEDHSGSDRTEGA